MKEKSLDDFILFNQEKKKKREDKCLFRKMNRLRKEREEEASSVLKINFENDYCFCSKAAAPEIISINSVVITA